MQETPDFHDVSVARDLAERIADVGMGRVRKVTLLGSRAKGIATASSDFDMMVQVELPRHEKPWTAKETIEERSRIKEALGSLPVKLDLWVRTTDQYYEGRRVIGGFEYFAEVEGVVVYSRPLRRQPIVRRSPDQVRRANVRNWLRDAHKSLRVSAGLSFGDGNDDDDIGDPSHYAWRCIQRCMTAVLVYYKVHSTKQDGLNVYLDKLKAVNSEISSWYRSVLGPGHQSISVAHTVLVETTQWLAQDPAMLRPLSDLLDELTRPIIFVT